MSIGNAATNGPGAPDSGFLAAPRWDDLSAAIIAARLDTASGRLDYDYFNGGVNFNSNARYPDEPVVIPVQMRHRCLIGAGQVFRPHIHWLQQQAAIPNFLLGYKKINNGVLTTFETDFTNYTFLTLSTHAFSYSSGVLPQISSFPEIDMSDLAISAQVNVVLFRDSANTSTLFAGVDPVGSGVVVTYQDSHVKFDGEGSRQEFVK